MSVRLLTPPSWTVSGTWVQVRRLGQYRDLLTTLSRHRLSVRYKQSKLGAAWAVLQPLAMMLVFTAVFAKLVRVPSEGVPYALFSYAGILPWTFFSGAVSNGTNSLVSHAQLVTKVFFPREILPLSYVIAAAVDLLIGAVVLLVLVVFYQVRLTSELPLVFPILLLLGLLSLECGLVLSAVQVRARDIGIALPIALQLLMFASPVLYPLREVPAAWRPLYLLNPLAGLIDGFRRSVLGIPIDAQAFTVAAVITITALPFAYMAFKFADVTVADVI
jgi:homopolymeric O-antigen transport system permease protein